MICILLGWICFRIFFCHFVWSFCLWSWFCKCFMKRTQMKCFTFCQWELNKILSHNNSFAGDLFDGLFFSFSFPLLVAVPKCLLLSPPYFFISLQILVTDHSISSPTHLDTRRSLRSPLCSPYRCHCPTLWPISKAFKVTRCWQLRAPTSSTRRMRSSRTPMSSMSTWRMSCPISCHSCRWVLDDCSICWWPWTQCFCC